MKNIFPMSSKRQRQTGILPMNQVRKPLEINKSIERGSWPVSRSEWNTKLSMRRVVARASRPCDLEPKLTGETPVPLPTHRFSGSKCDVSAWRNLSIMVLCLMFLNYARADSQATYLQCLTNFETYAESVWHPATYFGAPPDAGYWGNGVSDGNEGIRANSGVAILYATLVIAQPGNALNSHRLDRIRQALNYDTATHATVGSFNCVDGHQWVNGWQSSLWAGSMGLAGLLVQSNLTPATVSNVMAVVANEADYRAAIPPASGYLGDTKAEENAWQGNILTLAAAWLTNSPHASNWLYAAKNYCANTYTVANTNGDPLAAWISTVTLYPSYALENHGFYHPTYEMVAGMSLGDSLLMAHLANPAIGAEVQPFAEHNVMAVWTNNLDALVMDSGDFAYPSGVDWELHDFEQNSYITCLATHFNDPLARWTGEKLAQCVRYRQLVNGDGRFVGPSAGGFFREAVEARRTAIAWLHLADANFPTGPTTPPEPTIAFYPDVKVIHQRSAFGSFSFSYGSRIMGVIEPVALEVPTNAFIATPKNPGILGLGLLGNPTVATLVSFATNLNGFDAEFRLTNGVLGTTEVYIKGTGETLAMVEVPHPATGLSGTAPSFTCGIENDPLTGLTRLLEWSGGSAWLTNRSGALRNVTNNWVCVAGRYGLAAGPGGYFKYQTATSYNRLGAAEDALSFMPTNGLTPRYAVWFPAKNAAQTAAGAGQISWTTDGANGKLTFPGAGGAPAQIAAVLVTNLSLAYLPYPLPVTAVSASSNQPTFPPTNAVDGNFANYWVSKVSPKTNTQWLRVEFPRAAAVSGFQVTPRTDNGGYGPSTIFMVLNVTNTIPASGIPTSGTNVYSSTMAASSALNVMLSPPVYATNAVLVITGGYDVGNTNAPRNTQVNELTFFERALPGTFGDWAVRTFSATQLLNDSISGPAADPDGDGVANLMEFVVGGDALVGDAAKTNVQIVTAPGQFRLQFLERKNLAGVTRDFLSSTNLIVWSPIIPANVSVVQDLGGTEVKEAVFAASAAQGFFRIGYSQ
jgi:hypothetical protein